EVGLRAVRGGAAHLRVAAVGQRRVHEHGGGGGLDFGDFRELCVLAGGDEEPLVLLEVAAVEYEPGHAELRLSGGGGDGDALAVELDEDAVDVEVARREGEVVAAGGLA